MAERSIVAPCAGRVTGSERRPNLSEAFMVPHLTHKELVVFEAFVKSADNYVEFGSGGSTCLAASSVGSSVLAVDSSEAWLAKVGTYCATSSSAIVPTLLHVDIGATGDWGSPTDKGVRARWPDYHRTVWSNPAAADADLYFVDGRFRVACFMQILLRCEHDALIMIHDFVGRTQYHVVREVAREISTTDQLAVFRPLRGDFRGRARKILADHEFVAA